VSNNDEHHDGHGVRVTPVVHQNVIGLGGDGYRATCSCGWRSHASWDRGDVVKECDEHKRRSRLRSVP
jgi:hypothetical protein